MTKRKPPASVSHTEGTIAELKLKHRGWEEFFAKPPLQANLDPAELRATGPERSIDSDLAAKPPQPRRSN